MTIPGKDPASRLAHKHVVHENVVGGSSILRVIPLVIAVSERDMPGIEPEPILLTIILMESNHTSQTLHQSDFHGHDHHSIPHKHHFRKS